jgi:DNA-binding SARP family transcriptional activator
VEFLVLGPLHVMHAGEALALGGPQQRALLALLLVHPPEWVSRDRLIDELWGERPPPSAANAVQVHVSGIRKLLRAAAVRTSASGYRLDVDLGLVDARRFERLLDDAQHPLAGGSARALSLSEEAIGL